MMDLSGQVAVVTGASRGVGRGIAEAFSAAGARVVLAVRDHEAGEAVRSELHGEGLTVRCDVTRADDVDGLVTATLAQFGRLDHLVHNATSARSSEAVPLTEADRDLWNEHVAVALRALYRLAKASSAALASTRGSLLVLTSPAAIEGSETVPLYAAVKAGQRGFVRSLAREWGPTGVRVNALAPLAVSPSLANAMEENPLLRGRLEAVTPLQRVGDPRTDIGPAAVFLCSPAARYVTGQTLIVSGGRFTAL